MISEEKLKELESFSASVPRHPPEPPTCVRCESEMMIPGDLDPTAICDLCAQTIVIEEMPALIAEIRRLRGDKLGIVTGR
jgi:hypothetical protein